MTKRIENANHIATLPRGMHVISMCVWRDELFVATNKGVYRLVNNKLVLIRLEAHDVRV